MSYVYYKIVLAFALQGKNRKKSIKFRATGTYKDMRTI